MRSSAAIFILALVIVPHVRAGAGDVAKLKDGNCYSKYGLNLPSSYCDKGIAAALLPDIKGSGPFAKCALESSLRLIGTDGDADSIELRADGQVTGLEGLKIKPSSTTTLTAPGELTTLYKVFLPALDARHAATERDITIVKKNNLVTSASAVTYVLDPQGRKPQSGTSATTQMKFSYPNGKCQVDRVNMRLPGFSDVILYDGRLCSAVADFANSHKTMSEQELEAHEVSVINAFANDPARAKEPPFAFDQRAGKLPSMYSRTSLPTVISICKNSGAGLTLPASTPHKPLNLLPPGFNHSGQ